MKILLLALLFNASFQLQCDKRQITAHVGGEFSLLCRYDTNVYRYTKKYWCRGSSRNTCDILIDSDRISKPKDGRLHIVDARRNGLFVKMTDLQLDDSGMYWVGIDKPYADIMASIELVVTEVPVSKPILRPISPPVNTCWGQPVSVRCGCAQGTGVHYTWYQQHAQHEDVQLHSLPDLYLHCGGVQVDTQYYCDASNDISSQTSDILSVKVLVPTDDDCIYVIHIPDHTFYDCSSRLRTTSATSTHVMSSQPYMEIRNQTSNGTHTDWDVRHNRFDLYYQPYSFTSYINCQNIYGAFKI